MVLTFNRNFDPRHGEVVSVAPGVRRVTAPNAGPFTFTGTNTFVIGDDDIAVIDPGPDDPAHIEAVLQAIGQAKVRHILLTHSHRDHSAGTAALRENTGAPVYAGVRPRDTPPGDGLSLDAAIDRDVTPDMELVDGAVVEGTGYRIEAVATPGHSADHFAFALPGRDILFSGDHVMGWSTSVVAPPDGSMASYMASLDRLLARPETTYLPAHGAAIENARTYVRALGAHRRMRELAILDRLRQGDRTVGELVRNVYAGLDPALAGAAALSTLAHLEHLIGRNLVANGGGLTLDANYWPLEAGADVAAAAAAGSG